MRWCAPARRYSWQLSRLLGRQFSNTVRDIGELSLIGEGGRHCRLGLSPTLCYRPAAMGTTWPSITAKAPRFADRLEAWGAASLFGAFKFLPLDYASALGDALHDALALTGRLQTCSAQHQTRLIRAF